MVQAFSITDCTDMNYFATLMSNTDVTVEVRFQHDAPITYPRMARLL